MKFPLSRFFRIITQSDRWIYITGKKAVFALCFITVLSRFFPTQHTGDIVDIIWSNLYWWGPLLAFIIFLLLLWKASREVHSSEDLS